MRSSGRTSLPAALAAAALLLALRLSSQAPPAPPQPPAAAGGETFVESIDVEVVNVDVHVTDRSGRPVLGLTREDFELFADGKPVAITNFYAVAGGPAAAPVAAAPPAAAPPAAGAAAPPAAPAAIPEEQRLHLAVFLDNRNLTPPGRNRAVREIQEFLAARPRGPDRLLLVTYDGALEVRQAPTGDPAALAEALRQASRETARGAHDLAQMRLILHNLAQEAASGVSRSPSGFGGAVPPNEIRAQIETWAQGQQDVIRATLRSAGELVDWLGGLPGRKALLFVSGGLSMEPGENLMRAWNAKFGGGPSTDDSLRNRRLETQRLLGELAERANARRVTFYTVGAVESVQGLSAENAYIPEWTGQNLSAEEETNRAVSLLALAAETGGLASLNPDNAGALLARLHGDLDSYYSLGFTPVHPRDGRTHRLEVRVRGRAHAVRHREVYRSRTVGEEMQGYTLTALTLGQASNPLAVALDFGKAEKAGRGQIVLPVLVKFSLSDLVLVPRQDRHEGRVRLFIASRDEQGRASPVTEIEVPIEVPPGKLKASLAQRAAYGVNVRLPRGRVDLAVTVLDDLGKVSSTVRASYPPAGAPAS